ncbi:MAG: GTPase Der [Verrucomicrobia subdivision 3 bacterium]|nr:GTPase Der [Limisphaerales bacterium]MCS1416662.1 GTPase Der [Limisphaerales bacterium]
MTDHIKLDQKTKKLYRTALKPLADHLAFGLPVNPNDTARRPTALFLGNHSSGKSSFINHLLGTQLQKTGLAPTDDGFTIITYGEKTDSIDGQTVASHPELAYQDLQCLGPAFISRLRLRAEPNPVLQEFNMIDSPGMIDAVDRSNSREYDFERSIRIFAENSDIILFFFDPDKPGTTAETISVLTNTLAGLEHKLMIVMNKVDLFTTMRDFARSYGTLCWNLSKAITTKDIPHIFTTYLPELATPRADSGNKRIPLEDFDTARKEIVNEVKRTPTRRADNLVSDLLHAARNLAIQARVSDQIGIAYRNMKLRWHGSSAIICAVSAVAAWLLWKREVAWQNLAIGVGVALAIVTLIALFGKYRLNQFNQSLKRVEFLDPFFDQAYSNEITLGERLDLRAAWVGIREGMTRSLKVTPPTKFPLRMTRLRLLRRLERAIYDEIPKLRRQVGMESNESSPASGN